MNETFVFVDKENIYYLLNLDDRYGVFINTFRFENGKVAEFETPKKEVFEKYFSFWKNLSNVEKRDYIYNLCFALNYKISKRALKTLGEDFCFRYLRDLDEHFLFQDKFAKHFILDFKAIEQGREVFYRQPKLFPFYISYLDIWITEDYKIIKNNTEITTNDVFQLEEEYKKSLIPLIKKKDKIYRAVQKDSIKKYFKTKEFLKSMNICDKNIEIIITFFDIAGNDIHFNTCSEVTFERQIYDLKFWGINVEISRLLWGLIDKFGIRIVEAKLNVWSEIKTDLQMFYKI
ncbi:hypothetical protein C3L23_02120 [Nautilia sp. PV-1]|uniref:hypothetical protein n=1 Tax=Nautilia sp. PV-1 TaxID=2579250 RepID=UPI000FD8B555|nr:hypothetical protein [Nautilia sp. PV-1]AZV46108.1 hypothetical protein C3L23_02120 [Nautilia sp. PV-1]